MYNSFGGICLPTSSSRRGSTIINGLTSLPGGRQAVHGMPARFWRGTFACYA